MVPREVHHQVPWAIRRVLWLLAFLNLVGIGPFDYKKGPWPHRGRGEMAMAYDGRLRWLGFTNVQRLSRMMLPTGVGKDTGAECARRQLF